MLLLGGWDSSPHGSVPDTPCQWAALLDVKSRLEGGGEGVEGILGGTFVVGVSRQGGWKQL